MNWRDISSWSSASRRVPFPFSNSSVYVDARTCPERVTTSTPGFFYSVAMPFAPLAFRAIFKTRQGLFLLLEDDECFYWRPLARQEVEILRMWWDDHCYDYAPKAALSRQVNQYLRQCDPGVSICFATKHRWVWVNEYDAWLWNDQFQTWVRLKRRGLFQQLLNQAVRFWILVDGQDPQEALVLRLAEFAELVNTTECSAASSA